jgi:hypothetical protein
MSEWQPIETAPIPLFDKERWYMTSLRVLVWRPNCAEIGHYSYTERGKGRWQSEYGRNINPTHWMPLPEPPQ